jgi:hypothetical protein
LTLGLAAGNKIRSKAQAPEGNDGIGDGLELRGKLASRCVDAVTHVEFKRARNHNDILRMVDVCELSEPYSFGATDEEAASEPILILRDPVPAAVSANAEG